VSIPQAAAVSFPCHEALLVASFDPAQQAAASRGQAWLFFRGRLPDSELPEGVGMKLQRRDGDEQFSLRYRRALRRLI
jgi:hypothetical protein